MVALERFAVFQQLENGRRVSAVDPHNIGFGHSGFEVLWMMQPRALYLHHCNYRHKKTTSIRAIDQRRVELDFSHSTTITLLYADLRSSHEKGFSMEWGGIAVQAMFMMVSYQGFCIGFPGLFMPELDSFLDCHTESFWV